MNKVYKFFVSGISFIALLCFAVLMVPAVEGQIVLFVERIIDDDIVDRFWTQQIFGFSFFGAIAVLLLNLFLWSSRAMDFLRNVAADFCTKTKELFLHKKFLVVLFWLYCFGCLTIIRANFFQIAGDDLSRQILGSRDWKGWYRYIDEVFSIFIHTSPRLIDIAPLTQFMALAFTAFSSYCLIYIFNNKKFSHFVCFVSLVAGLSPYFLTNLAYRYDSPYMALSMAACIFPFVFVQNLRTFAVASVLGILVMCTTYQASAGVYIVITLALSLKFYLFDKKSLREIFSFDVICALCFLLTLLAFKFAFIEPPNTGAYVTTEVSLFAIPKNIFSYFAFLGQGLGVSAISVCFVLSLLCFVALTVLKSRQGRAASFFAVLLFLALALPFTFGIYIVLSQLDFSCREFIGIGVLSAIVLIWICNLSVGEKKKAAFPLVVCFALSYSVLSYSYAYGNAQYDQKIYKRFRTEMLVHDLSLVMDGSYSDCEILFTNSIDLAPQVKNLERVYPVAAQGIDWGFETIRGGQWLLASKNLIEFKSGKSSRLSEEDLPVLMETAYHIIRGRKNHYLVTFKTPDFTIIEHRHYVDE